MTSSVQTSKTIGDFHTDIVIQSFADRVLVLITQLGKVGNFDPSDNTSNHTTASSTRTRSRTPHAPRLPPPPPSIQLTPLLGAPPSEHLRTLHSLYASQAATLVWTAEANGVLGEAPRRAVIVGIALKRRPESEGDDSAAALSDGERDTFLAVMGLVGGLLER